jgi:hypothetical protein
VISVLLGLNLSRKGYLRYGEPLVANMHGNRKEADKRLLLINPTRSPHLLAPAAPCCTGCRCKKTTVIAMDIHG